MKTLPAGPEVKVQNRGFLKKIEFFGNMLPNPAVLFILLLLTLAIISAILASVNVTSIDPLTHKSIYVKNLLSKEGVQWMLTEMIRNYINFPPLGMIIVLTFGMGLVERVGLMEVAIKQSIHSIPKRGVTFAIVLISFMSHIASDASLMIVPPIAAMVFYSLGRHPYAGFAASLAAIYCGFSANILIVTTDVLLSGITTQAAKVIDPTAFVSPVDNWYFMSFSVIFLSIVTTIVTEKFVEPRLGEYKGTKAFSFDKPTGEQIAAMKATGVAAIIYIAILLMMVVPEGALLRNPQTGTILNSPLMRSIVPLLFMFLLTIGITYGIKIGIIRKADDVIKMMTESVKSLAGFLVMVFGITQFIAAFGWTNLATLMATSGSEFLKSINMDGLPALLCFMLFSQLVGCFVAGGSATWALLSPVFVPMFMLMGYHPAFIQVAFRAGDGSLNPIAPVNTFLPFFLDAMQQYKKEAGIGTYLSLMMPYALSFLVMWYLLFCFWHLVGWPVGPGIPQRLW